MKGGKAPLGYTIVEVMIVLVISGAMLGIAAQFISGKQAATTFTQGVNEMASRLQSTIEQVSNGQYTDVQLSCTIVSDRARFSAAAPAAGSDKNCTYMGKMFHFVQSERSTDPEEYYEVFTLAGARLDDSSPRKPVTDLSKSAIAPVIDTSVSPPNQLLTVQEVVPYHLRIKGVYVNGTSSHYGVGFIQSLGSVETDTGGLKTGPQTVKLYVAEGITRDQNTTEAASRIKPYVSGVGLQEAQDVVICMTDENRYAEIILGRNNNTLSVNVNMRGTETCVR